MDDVLRNIRVFPHNFEASVLQNSQATNSTATGTGMLKGKIHFCTLWKIFEHDISSSILPTPDDREAQNRCQYDAPDEDDDDDPHDYGEEYEEGFDAQDEEESDINVGLSLKIMGL
ncbi:hypothetical protein QJS10_CPA06g01012 [Acorus calamus]|uniref:Uncharacterized protein n=1 Tax=Acorus calamus TaxID=4465 RepID=A0AAV9ERQ1_ACOCL|nr:hypothetical protein QJS10_CPA06g01012 [Acorus calamus]